MSLAVKAENLSKAYQLGEIGTGTISRDLERWWARRTGKEDPYIKIGEKNDRTVKGNSDVIWSLKDINFQINQGEAVGIIGRNGAGKSTLLKILSRVTSPTTGSVKIKGRIASLLEVGTGFHPELTGRENIYLNGAILGMRKKEITKKFDDMVDFAGVERYIDTPVKRYSSGMYVRLAFAVAAYLESEILIVDEVLAVGDAEFQKKCLGKMGDISKGDGRTILFVSHNMGAIRSLCGSAILLAEGLMQGNGKTGEIINEYLKSAVILQNSLESANIKRTGSGKIIFESAKTLNENNEEVNEFFVGDTIQLVFEINNPELLKNSAIGIQVKGIDDVPLLHMMNIDSGFPIIHQQNFESYKICIRDFPLFPGDYKITLTIADPGGHEVYDNIEGCMNVTILQGGEKVRRPLPKEAGLFFLTPEWSKLNL